MGIYVCREYSSCLALIYQENFHKLWCFSVYAWFSRVHWPSVLRRASVQRSELPLPSSQVYFPVKQLGWKDKSPRITWKGAEPQILRHGWSSRTELNNRTHAERHAESDFPSPYCCLISISVFSGKGIFNKINLLLNLRFKSHFLRNMTKIKQFLFKIIWGKMSGMNKLEKKICITTWERKDYRLID